MGTRHKAITAQLDCSACHSPAGWRSLQSGQPGAGFDHDRTGFPLRGQHRALGCTDCHQAERALTRRCNGCHTDAHQGRLSADCSQCHSADGWPRTDAIERHRRTRLPLTGMHALADCVDCHRRQNDRAWSSVQADCYACHYDDYQRSDVHPVHVGSGTSAPFDRNCGGCHRASGWSPAIVPVGLFSQALSATAPALQHDPRFLLSHGPHRDSACSDCHAGGERGGPVSCIGCHTHAPQRLRSQHRAGQPPTQARACLGCHPGGLAR